MDESRRCRAKSKRSGNRCKHPAMIGGFVCDKHGGKAPQVKRKAAERVMDIIDPDRTLRTTAAIAFADITEIYDEHYNLRPIKEWPEGLRHAVKRIEPRLANVDPGDGAADKVLRVELHDKVKALGFLLQHFGLLKEAVQHEGEITFRWAK